MKSRGNSIFKNETYQRRYNQSNQLDLSIGKGLDKIRQGPDSKKLNSSHYFGKLQSEYQVKNLDTRTESSTKNKFNHQPILLGNKHLEKTNL